MPERLMAEWLDTVEALPESELPVDHSTIAYAVRTAAAYRQEARTWQALFEELAGQNLGDGGVAQ